MLWSSGALSQLPASECEDSLQGRVAALPLCHTAHNKLHKGLGLLQGMEAVQGL